jgi:hypothetical protein
MSLGLPEATQLLDHRPFRTRSHRVSPDGYGQFVVGEGDVSITPVLPGFELPLDRLLGRADLWD